MLQLSFPFQQTSPVTHFWLGLARRRLVGSVSCRLFIYAQKVGWTSDSYSYLAFIFAIASVIVWGMPGLVDEDAGRIPIRGYGVMMLIAVVTAVALQSTEHGESGFPTRRFIRWHFG